MSEMDTFTVHIDFGRHECRDFTVHDTPAHHRTHEEAAQCLCRLVGGLTWEVRECSAK